MWLKKTRIIEPLAVTVDIQNYRIDAFVSVDTFTAADFCTWTHTTRGLQLISLQSRIFT